MHSFKLPYHLLVEEGIFSRIDEVMADVVPNIGQKKAVLVTEENLVNIFKDIIPNIKNDFDDCELYLVEDGYFDDAMALAKHIVVEDIEVVIGFGGGKVLDLAKYASFVSKTMFLCLPTTLSNDSLASPVAVLGTEGKARKTFKCTIPASIIIDVNIIMSAPVKQTLSGIGDTISKYTALNDWKIAMAKDKATVDDFSYMMSKMAFNSICFNEEKDVKSKSFIKILSQALVMGGLAMEIAGNSRPSSGSEHLFCHALEENFSEIVNVPHGIAVAMGSYGACVFQKRNIGKITRVIKEYDLPVKPSAWNITEEIFIKAWQQAAETRKDRYTILNETDLSDERLAALYHEMEETF